MEVELPEATIDDSEFVLDGSSYENYGRYMRLHLLDKYDNPLLGRSKLIENRLKTVQGPSKGNSQLSAYLFSVTENTVKKVAVNAAGEDNGMDSEIESLLSGKNCVVIDRLINQFIKKLPEIQPREMELEELRQQFVNDFNMNKLMNMTKEEYLCIFSDEHLDYFIKNLICNLIQQMTS